MIQANNLIKRFGAFTAVAGVSLDVRPGEILALLGPNGAGKTTTVRMLASLLRPTSGSATIAGFDTMADPAAVRKAVGLLTELPGIYQRMSAEDYLRFFGDLYGVSKTDFEFRSRHLLEYFDLWNARDRAIGTYSKGMRQKMSLSRALLHDPQVILLDEPTSAMDPASAKSVRDYIWGLKAQGRTFLICTHNLAEAETLADRIAIIQAGRIVAEGTAGELKQRLLGQPLFEIRFGSPIDPDILNFNGVLHIEHSADTWLRYSTPDPRSANPVFLKYLVEAGADIISVSPVPQSLEDVYLRMVEPPDPEPVEG